MHETFDALKEWWIWGLSTIAGFVSHGQEFNIEDKWKVQLTKLLIRLSTAIFAGLMAYILATALGLSNIWKWLAVGLIAWRGTQGLQMISAILDKRLGVSADRDSAK